VTIITKETRYWDTCCFLAYLQNEPNTSEKCASVLEEAENGNLMILTSALTLAEVIKLKGKKPLSKNENQKIKNFFNNSDYIVVRNVDRVIAESARELMWKHQHLHHKDSIHLATALHHRIKILETFDEDLLKINGHINDIIIQEPFVVSQRKLALVIPEAKIGN